jgi:hypothetical protein
MEAVYIMHIREFINSNQDIYKIGRTSQERTKRADSYPKGSYLLYHTRVKDSCDIENQIMACFKETFIHRREFGSEYFEGDYEEMRDAIYDIVKIDERKRKEKVAEVKSDADAADAAVESSVEDVEEAHETAAIVLEPHHFNKMNTTTCKTCLKNFTTPVNLKIHMNRKIPCLTPELAALIPPKKKKMYKFKCERCDRTFETSQNLRTHLAKSNPCVIKVSTPHEEIQIGILFD